MIDVAPAITPASNVTVPSKVMDCPAVGVIARVDAPADDMVLPFSVMSSTVRAVSVPREVMLGCAAAVVAVFGARPAIVPYSGRL